MFEKIFLVIILTLTTVSSHKFLDKNTSNNIQSNGPKSYCTTQGCLDAAKVIRNYMDPSFDPCKNFYAFTCGGFYKKSKIPEGQEIISPIHIMKRNVNVRLKKLLDEKIELDEPRIFSLTKTFFKSCLQMENEDGDAELRGIIKELGGWPVAEGENWNETAFDWVDVDINLRSLGYPPVNIFSVFVEKTYVLVETKKTPLIHVNPLTPHISIAALKNGTTNIVTNSYRKLMYAVAEYFNASEERAEHEMQDVLNFETTLVKAATRIGKGKLFLTKIEGLEKELPSVPWKKYIDGLIQPIVENISTTNPIIKLRNPWYFSNIKKLLKKTSKRTIANYMVWRTIVTSLPYLGGKIRKFLNKERERFKYLPMELPGTPKECLKLVSDKNGLSVGVSSIYVRKYFDNKTLTAIQPILQSIFDEFEKVLSQVKWLDEESKEKAKEKNIFMKRIIAYPSELLNNTAIDNYIRNLYIDESHFFRNVLNLRRFHYDFSLTGLVEEPNQKFWVKLSESTSTNAVYYGDHNAFILLAGLLQPPLFNIDWPYSAKFGSIGFITAHEMMHAYDFINVNKDYCGNFMPWMNMKESDLYTKKRDCFIYQYRNYKNSILNVSVAGNFTSDENIADNIGLKIAHNAYKVWELEHPNELPLPGLNLTPEQIFWMTSVHFLCNKNTNNYIGSVMILKGDTHLPGGFRVRGSVSNSRNFSKAFSCPVGSPMNPRKKCELF